jgi:hypothetical protein
MLYANVLAGYFVARRPVVAPLKRAWSVSTRPFSRAWPAADLDGFLVRRVARLFARTGMHHAHRRAPFSRAWPAADGFLVRRVARPFARTGMHHAHLQKR